MTSEVVGELVGGILGGGILGGGAAFYVALKRTPAEVKDIAVTGSETAVVALERAVAVAEKQRDDAIEDARQVRAENEQLHSMIADLRKDAEAMAAQLASFQTKLAAYEAAVGLPPQPAG